MGSCASPALPASYADVDGNIGFRLSGFIPLRKAGGGRLPAPGWDRSWDWRGYIPFEEMPEVFNPPSGLIVAANTPIAYSRYPLVTEPSTGYRAQRILEQLATGTRTTVEDCIALQADVLSLPGLRLARLLVDRLGGPADADLEPALDELHRWDGRATQDSAGAAIYETALHRLVEDWLGSQLHPALTP